MLEDGREFRVDVEDLYRHTYVIGKTGAGESTLLLNLALRLWRTGKVTVIVIDPHGDLARDIVEAAPSLERVYYLDAGGGTSLLTRGTRRGWATRSSRGA